MSRVSTITTVGYGDRYPVTPAGRATFLKGRKARIHRGDLSEIHLM